MVSSGRGLRIPSGRRDEHDETLVARGATGTAARIAKRIAAGLRRVAAQCSALGPTGAAWVEPYMRGRCASKVTGLAMSGLVVVSMAACRAAGAQPELDECQAEESISERRGTPVYPALPGPSA